MSLTKTKTLIALSSLFVAPFAAFPAQSQTIFWTDTDASQQAIYSADIDGSNPTKLVDIPAVFGPSPRGRYLPGEITNNGNFIFWEDTNIINDDKIYRAGIDGSNPIVLLDLQSELGLSDYQTFGMAAFGESIFWTDFRQDAIYTAGIDGSNPSVLIDLDAVLGVGDYSPQGIATDGVSLFWVDLSGQNRIYKADIDGSNTTELFNVSSEFGTGSYNNLTISGNFLYGTSGTNDLIYRVGTDGSDPVVLIDLQSDIGPGTYNPSDIAADGNFLFWPSFNAQRNINRANIDGSEPGSLIDPVTDIGPGTYNPRSITVLQNQQTQSVPEPTSIMGILVLGTLGLLGKKR